MKRSTTYNQAGKSPLTKILAKRKGSSAADDPYGSDDDAKDKIEMSDLESQMDDYRIDETSQNDTSFGSVDGK